MAESAVPKDLMDGEGVKVVNYSLRLSTIAALEEEKRRSGVPMSRIVDEAILERIQRLKEERER